MDKPGRGLSPEQLRLIRSRLRAHASGQAASGPVLTPRPDQERQELSFAQRRLWFFDQLLPGCVAYNMNRAYRMVGRLDLDALHRALEEIVARHESLRTTFRTVSGEPRQVFHPPRPIGLPLTDLSSLGLAEAVAEARRLVGTDSQTPFDLAEGPLFRDQVLRLGPADHVLSLTFHHIVFDGWSVQVLHQELTSLYQAFTLGRPSPLEPLAVQYADYAAWQRAWLTGDRLEQHLAYWRDQLAGMPPALELPWDRPRPAQQSFQGGACRFSVSSEVIEGLQALSRERNATLFMVLLAAFQALLTHSTGGDDIVVGSPIAGRNHTQVEGLIGFFVNSLPLRSDCSGDPSFADLVGRVREVVLDAWAHQDVPFERVVEELAPPRDPSRSPVIQVWFDLHGRTVLPQLADMQTVAFETQVETIRFDLEMHLALSDEGLVGHVVYSVDLFEVATIDGLVERFRALLASIVTNPHLRLSALKPVGEDKRRRRPPGSASSALEGKADHKALTAPPRPRPDAESGFEAARSPEEETIAGVWAELLGLERVGIHDSFFELGGHSLLAIEVIFSLQEAFDVDLPVQLVFENPTVAELAQVVKREAAGRAEQADTGPVLTPPVAGIAEALQRGRVLPSTRSLTDVLASAGEGESDLAFLTNNLPARAAEQGAQILLTGATGFFGAFLLRELLAQTQGRVHCLIRAANAPEAWHKLRENLDKYGLWDSDCTARLSVVVGDLAKPELGLGAEEFKRLADQINTIYHNGAHVDVLFPYEQLKDANVGGTRELLRLATTSWLKGFHLVSTSSAARLDRPERGDAPVSGYVESKWRAERLVLAARSKGVPASIYRVPRLAGDSRTGGGNDRDIVFRIIRRILDLGAAPDVDISETWVPVNEAAHLLISTSREHRNGGLFAVTTPQPVRLRELFELACGVNIKPITEWESDFAASFPEEHQVIRSIFELDSSARLSDIEQTPAPESNPSHDIDFARIVARKINQRTMQLYLEHLSR